MIAPGLDHWMEAAIRDRELFDGADVLSMVGCTVPKARWWGHWTAKNLNAGKQLPTETYDSILIPEEEKSDKKQMG